MVEVLRKWEERVLERNGDGCERAKGLLKERRARGCLRRVK